MSKLPQAKPTVQVDNERVRITEWRFAPGAETGEHIHQMDYVVVPGGDGRLKLVSPEGQESFAELEAGCILLPKGRRASQCHQCQRLRVCVRRDRAEELRTPMTTQVTFELDGRACRGRTRRDDLAGAQRHGTKIPHLCWHPAPATGRTATAAPVWSKWKANGCWRLRASARPLPA